MPQEPYPTSEIGCLSWGILFMCGVIVASMQLILFYEALKAAGASIGVWVIFWLYMPLSVILAIITRFVRDR